MSLWNVFITKQCTPQGRHWGNRYLVDATDLTVALACGEAIVNQEKQIHGPTVSYMNLRVSDLIADNDVFVTIPLSDVGVWGISGQPLPVILTMNIAIVVAGFGRPSRKFYHTVMTENDVDSGFWNETALGAAATTIAGMIDDVHAAGGELQDPDGQAWTTAVVRTQPGHHKFSKRSRIAPL